jgi:hypothetical protein
MDADETLSGSIQTAQLHSDALGEWVVIDDGPDYAEALLVPVSFDHRQPLSRAEAAERFRAIDSIPAELDSMRRAFDALDRLDASARVRAVRWLTDRLGIGDVSAPALPPAPAPDARLEARREWVHVAWLADTPAEAMAEALGITRPALANMVHRMRRDGWDVPQRKRRAHGT